MRMEQIPIVLGVLVALMGLTIALDAWQAGGVAPLRESRRRTRARLVVVAASPVAAEGGDDGR